jgi:small-conductance mechanosensitive channel
MTDAEEKRTPWFLWPFHALWRLLTLILSATGRLLLAVLGIALMVVGLVIALTVVGAPVGIPLAILGFLLLLRALF